MKKIRILLIALILILGGALFSKAYAATSQRSLGANMQRPFTPAKYQYGVVGASEGETLYYTLVKIYDNEDKDSAQDLLYTRPFYCLRGGLGFGAGESNPNTDVSKDPVAYIQGFENSDSEMHTDAKNVIAKYLELYNVNLDRTEKFTAKDSTEKDVNIYNAILWILDESYLPKDRTNSENKVVYNAAEYKKELLDKAGVPSVQQEQITDDALEAIQQLAIWYFANYDEQTKGTNPTVSQSLMFPSQFLKINGSNNIDDTIANNLDRIYGYLIYGAIDNADSYEIDSTTGTRTKNIAKSEFDTSTQLTMTSGGTGANAYYKIGPVKIKNDANSRATTQVIDANQIVLYDANGDAIPKIHVISEITEYPDGTEEVQNGGVNVIYKFIDKDGNEVENLQTGLEYYIKFYRGFEEGNSLEIPGATKYNVSKISLKITSSYNLSTANFLYAQENASNNQAVVEIDKEKISDPSEITTKSFDLSLRKFITSINGETLTGENSRVPSINTDTLINGITNRNGQTEYTATYSHKKNALEVETGNKVVYTIRIYNEGELDGTATKVTDYLPAGLELVPASESEINDRYKWQPLADDNKIIETDYLATTTIKAFDKTLTKETAGEGWQEADQGVSGLYYADLQVECIVKANVTGEDQSLRNIAAITEDTADDRDSVPGDPGRDDYNPPADNSTYKQDDDDYEDLVLPGKTFDLSLRKFISKVERVNKETNELEEIEIASREPIIDIKGLKDGTSDTARYVHPKNKLSLKRGDIIYYTIRVYNEGELDGYATEIKDYLPEGLELVEGKNDIWEVNGNTLKTDTLKDQKLLGYNKDTTSVQEGVKWQKASNDETGLYYYDLTVVCRIKDDVQDGATLVNIAEITGDESEPTDIDDRDSQPGNFPDANKNNDYEGNGDDNGYFPGKQDDDDFERVTVEPDEVFDLALRKYIVAKNDKPLSGADSRVPNIDVTPLKQSETTADYKHRKDPVEVEAGNTVTYRFTVYNEGDIDGYVYSITDYLPEGLELDTTDLTKKDSDDENLEIWEKDVFDGFVPGNTYHSEFVFNKNSRVLTITRTTYHASSVIDPETGNLKDGTTDNFIFKLKAFDGTTLDSDSIDIKFKVTAKNSNKDQILTNAATMTYGSTENLATEQTIADRDSQGEEFTVPSQEQLVSESETAYKGNTSNKDELNDSTYHYEGQQDDDDFEKIVIKGKPFDLSLRKFITSIKRNGKEVEFDDREPQIDLTTLINGTFDRNGKKEYTATYNHSKDPLVVKKGDIVTYTLRIYNEGERDGFATEITDYIPEGLALILNYNTNFDNGWKLPKDINTETQLMDLVGEKGFYKSESDVQNLTIEDFEGVENLKDVQLATGKVTITSNMLQEELIKAFDKDKKTEEAGWQPAYDENGNIVGGLYYKDIEVSCLVIAENTCKDVLTNIAEISEDKDEYKQDVIDRDSDPGNVKTKNEDDDDYEPVVLKYFDLALRKFITGVETAGKTENVTSRIPTPKMGEDGNIVYEHSKDPVKVANNDTVIYTIRVYNEGTLAGYAEEITDDIPEGLEYLPEHSINKKYEWKMYDKDGEITENVEEAVKITTDYLSEENEIKSKMTVTDETTGETSTPTASRNNLIRPFDSSKAISNEEPLNPDYKDVQVAFKVTEPNTSDRIIVNSAQISEDSDDDEDSDPGKWNEGEDDQDREYIYVKYFDLSLLKWVTQTVVTVDGKTTTKETGFEPNTGKTETTGIRDNNEAEPIAKVEIHRKKVSKTTVKFVYNIRVTNEGEIAGYATEITDYIPEGLEFLSEDNKAFGWVEDGDNKVTTRALETVLLEPGESATVQIVFTWKNDANNLGLKTNIAEISEDYNEYNSKDIDSIPDNKQDPYEAEQEDDDDFALVILTITTGKGASYTLLIVSMLTLLASGMYLIKKYVLKY